MRYRLLLLALAALLPAQVARAIEPADLKPGLVATFRSSANAPNTKGASVTRLEPTVAFTLNAGESAHPKLGVTAVAEWTGYINVTRTGKYSFSALVRGGTLTVKVGGKQVASAGSQGSTEDVVNLEGGVQSFEARFVRGNEPTARVELFWQGAGFIKEPLPNQFLGHLAKDRPEHFTTDAALEHGRFKFEELGCVKCHRASTDDKMARELVEHTGPNLTEIAKRAYPGWIYTWLEDPTKLRTHTTMPKTFRNDATGAAERFAVTQYLISLSGKPLDVYKLPTIPSDQIKQSMDRGRVLYSVAGCAACHSDPLPKKKKDDDEEKEPLAPVDFVYGLGTLSGPTPKYSLGGLGSKTRPEALAAYLANPLKTNPHGRMPNMNLNAGEAIDLARYLCRVPDENVTPEMPEPESTPIALLPTVFPKLTAEEQKRFARLKPQSQWAELGAQLALTKGCVNCHSIEQNGKPVQPLQTDVVPTLDQIKKADAKGCLTEKPNATKAPVYKLDPKEREDIAAFVRTGLEGDGAPAPAYQARVALRRFNCLNCHQRDGEGGIPTELADQMRQLEKAENADDVRPPMLTGVGHKTRTSWLKAVLTQSGRARPWMQLRMPQYGEPNVGFLPEAVAALEGTVPDDKVHVVERTAAKVAAGREIIGKGGLGCISCHDIGGYTNTGTRGPNLATIDQRVRYEWYERWLSQPLRMAPGTRMPQAFVDGKSTLTTMLNASPHLQGEAMWAYLALGPDLPLPDGLEPPRGVVVAVKDRPEVLRTFMPDAGSKAVAVGYPGYVSLAFSADQCRTAYAWGGNFLDASPVWANRGGNPAKLLGQKFWTAPPGHPWGLTKVGAAPPDFLTRANNPAFGLPMPLEPARIYDGPMAVKFDGYSLDKDGKPTFRYRLDETLKGQPELAVAETPVPLKGSVATGLSRKFELVIPGGSQAWFLAGVTNKEPRLYDATGKAITLDLKAEEVTAPAAARVILSADGRATLVDAAGAPDGSSWRFVPTKSGEWLAVLKLPCAKGEKIVRFALNLWALPKDDDTILKELFGR